MNSVSRLDRAWWAFQVRVELLGGVVLESEWLGAYRPHRLRCANGHACQPQPRNVQQGQGLCPKCARNDPTAAEADFHSRVAELGGTVMEPSWLGNKTPHRVRCTEGHDCSPRPADVQQGQGFCLTCAGHDYDAFYVVSGVDRVTGLPTVKPGVTSGDCRSRMSKHAADGMRAGHGVWTDLPDGAARSCELSLLAHLADEGWAPTRGVEYFPIAALSDVLTFCRDVLGCKV